MASAIRLAEIVFWNSQVFGFIFLGNSLALGIHRWFQPCAPGLDQGMHREGKGALSPAMGKVVWADWGGLQRLTGGELENKATNPLPLSSVVNTCSAVLSCLSP